MTLFLTLLLVHFGLGAALGSLTSTLMRNRRWRPFRFGGSDPLTLGTGKLWFIWTVLVVLPFQLVLSYIFSALLGVVPGMWLLQTLTMSLGLFVADRVAMMFEPENTALAAGQMTPVVPDLPATQQSTAAPKVAAPLVNDPGTTWIEKRLDTTTERIAEIKNDIGNIPSQAAEKVRTAVSETIDGVKKTVADKKNDREKEKNNALDAAKAEREKRLKNFDEHVKGH